MRDINEQTLEALTSSTGERFIKISADGNPLPASATNFVAVQSLDTGLMWSVEETPEMTQPECIEHVKTLRTAGFSDWRLPTRKELLGLIDDTRYSPAIDTEFFPDCKSDRYWSSTVDASSPADCAWVVYFRGGASHWYYQNGEGFVRAVRAGQLSKLGGSQS